MRSRLESLDAQIAAARAAAADASSRAESASSNRAAAEAEVNVARDAYDAAEAAVANHRRAIAGHSERLAQISSEIDAAQRAATDAKVELKTLEHKCARAEKERAQVSVADGNGQVVCMALAHHGSHRSLLLPPG